jgi:hypothetical protein
MESPERDPLVYSQLIFDQRTRQCKEEKIVIHSLQKLTQMSYRLKCKMLSL